MIEDSSAEMIPLKWVAVFVVVAIFATTVSLPRALYTSQPLMPDAAI